MEGNWNPIKASRDNIGISHLFFADDLMLFATATEENSETIKEVLELFCTESGQKISTCKSRVYFSQNVDDDLKGRICGNLNIQATNNLGKYLGFPLKHKNVERNQYNFIVERVINRLAGWKSKFLSFASRTVLVKSVMLAMSNHVMQEVTLPSHLCEKLDKINRDFLWGYSTDGKKKMHLVGWNKIIKPKEQGGLGIQSAKEKNIALLAKLNWRMYQEKMLFGPR